MSIDKPYRLMRSYGGVMRTQMRKYLLIAALAAATFPVLSFIFAGFDLLASFGMEPEPFVDTYRRGAMVALWCYSIAVVVGAFVIGIRILDNPDA